MRSAQPRRVRRPLGVGVAVLLAHAIAGDSQTSIDLSTQSKVVVDFSGASSTKPSRTGAALPESCSIGETYFKTDAPAGQNLYLCTDTDVWTVSAGRDGSNGFLSEPGLISLTTPTDAVSLGAATGLGKLAVVGTSDQTQTLIRGFAGQTQDLLQAQRSDGSVLARIDKDGFFTQGIGSTGGHTFQLGNAGDSGRSSITVNPGNTAALPPFLQMPDHTGNLSVLFPCGGLPGRWCQDSVIPGVAYTNPLLSTTSSDTVSNKIFDNSNRQNGYLDWDEIALPGSNPGTGQLRIYARAGNICWLTSGGAETCTGAGGGADADATYIVQTSAGAPANAQVLASLATGLLKNTAETGALSIAAAADLPAHASSHGHGGSDEIGAATPAANAIPKADASGRLDPGYMPLGSSAGTANQGGWWMWPDLTAATTLSSFVPSRQYMSIVSLPYRSTFGRISFEVTAANTTDCDGGGNCGMVMRLWRGDGAEEVATSQTITTDLNSTGVKTVELTSSVTLDAGMYFFSVGTDSKTVALRATTMVASLGPIMNAVSPRIGYCANPMTGSAATLAFPPSCGAITGALRAYPALFWEP